MNSNAELQQCIEETLVQMGKDNAKIMSAQLVALVEQIRNGGPSKTTVVWEQEDTPKAIRELIYADPDRAQTLNYNNGFTYAVLLPQGKTSVPFLTDPAPFFNVQLPQNKLVVYY